MVGGLQGENGDLDIKKSKEKYLTMSVATIGKLQENFAGAQNGCEISQPCEIGLQLGVICFQWL